MLRIQEELLRRELRKGDNLCRERTTPMSHKLSLKVKHIYAKSSSYLTTDTPLIKASHMGLVCMVWGFIECAKQTSTQFLTGGKFGEFQNLLWHRNALNKTALDVATEEGHDEVAKLLLENASLDCLISQRNHEGTLPVSMLPGRQHDMFIWFTLEKARAAAVDPPASTSIWIGQENLLQEANGYKKSIMNPKSYPRSQNHEPRDSLENLDKGTLELTRNGNTILHLASKIGDKKYAHDILVKHPYLVYHRNSDGETPAYVAAREGHVDILAIMISYFQAKKDDIIALVTRSLDNHNALHISIQNHHVGIVFWLMKEIPQVANSINDLKESPIYLAAERGYYHLLKLMLDKDRTRTFNGPGGKTALHAAAISGSKECIAYLLHEGIDQHKQDEQGYTPLQYAVNHNNTLATSELVDADPSIVYELIKEDDMNTSVFHIAASRGYCETLKVLMTQCPECSEFLDEKGKNIFHVAVENKQTEVIEFIYGDKSYISLVNQKDKDGNTPIHLLVACDLEIMEVAMDYRVDINALNNAKLTPLDMASSNEKRKRLVERIAMDTHKHGTSPSLINKIGSHAKKVEENFKLVENMLIVVTLIATATYASAFTVPGGLDGNEGSKHGTPILLRKAAFQAFMVTNTIAFSCSCSVLGAYIALLVYRMKSGELDEKHYKKIHNTILGMYYLTGYALLAMTIAFVTGIYVVLTPYHGFAIFLCVLSLGIIACMNFFPSIFGFLVGVYISMIWSSNEYA